MSPDHNPARGTRHIRDLSLGSILLALSCELMAENLVLNPSFEQGVSKPAVWVSGGKEKVVWANEAATGKRSIALENREQSPKYSYFNQGFKLQANTVYRLSFRYRTRLKKGKARVRITNMLPAPNGDKKPEVLHFYLPEYQEFDPVAGAARWKDHALVFNTGNGAKTYVGVDLSGKPGQKAWFDDFHLQPFWLSNPRTIDACEIATAARVNCFFENLVSAENPSRIASKKLVRAKGGLDAGQEGDDACFILASHGDKRWHGGVSNPEGIGICVAVAPDAERVEVEVGYFNDKYVTREFKITLDGMVLGRVRTPPGEYGSKDNRLKVFRAAADLVPSVPRPRHLTLRIFQTDSWGWTIIDAVAIRGKGVSLLDPHTHKPLGDTAAILRERRELIAKSQVKLKMTNLETLALGSAGDRGSRFRIEPSAWSKPKTLDERPCRAVLPRIDWEEYSKKFGRSRDTSVDATGAVFSAPALAADGAGLPERSIGLELTYRDDLDQPALFYSWMGFHKNRPWELLKGSPSQVEVDAIGGENDKQWKTTRFVIPKTPLTRLRAKEGRYCFKLASYRELPVAAIRLFTLSDAETEAWAKESAERRMLKYNLHRRPFVERRKRRVPTPRQRRLGYILQARSELSLVFPNSAPAASASGALELKAWTVPGRAANATFAFFPLGRVGRVRLEVGDLKSREGVVKAETIGIKVARYMMMSYPAFRAQGCFIRAPYSLLDAGDVYVGGEAKWFWLIFNVPEDTVAGAYRGKLKLTTNDASQGIPVTLEALPLRLRNTGRFFAMYPGYAVDPNRFDFDQIETFLRNQREYGMNASMLAWRFFLYNGVLDWRKYNPEDGSFDVELMDRMIRLFRKHGLLENNRLMLVSPKPSMIENFDGADRFKAYGDIVRAVEREGKKRGWPQLIWLPADEPGESNMAYSRRCVQTIKAAGGVTGGTVQQWSVEQYGPPLDVRVYGSRWFAQSRSIDGLFDIKSDVANGYAGAQLASYGQNWGLRAMEERSSAWWLWKSAKIPEGFTMLRWNYLNYWYDGYDNLDAIYEPEGWLRYDVGVAPAWRGGVCSTIIWEEIRQSIIDLEFVYTLEKLIAAAKERGLTRAAARAQAALDVVKEQIPDDRGAFAQRYILKPFPALQEGASDFYTDYSFDFETFSRWRRRIAEAAVQLEQGLAE